ncbi:MAG: cob(I)yrinic acid a,c-diamide adenosyltransferase [Nitrospirota bacterium]|nr:cob(I)yrinic acid a,c-diamide adenosyltransferase [Nitrospirota bacterium]
MRKGFVQVYTGNGKGKTTAALGLAVRAAGAGMKVFIAQFIKSRRTSEHHALERFEDSITVRQYGKGLLIGRKPGVADLRAARKGYEEVRDALRERQYDLVIMDEANVAVHCGLLSVEELLDIMQSRPKDVELVITGRYADKRIMDAADLVTEMKEIRHYWSKGTQARRGIEK